MERGPLRLAFNVRYLLDALSVSQGEGELRLDGPLSPLLIRRRGSDQMLLVMLVRASV